MSQLYFFTVGVLAATVMPRIVVVCIALSKQQFKSNSLFLWLAAVVIAIVATFATDFVKSRWKR